MFLNLIILINLRNYGIVPDRQGFAFMISDTLRYLRESRGE